MVKWALVLTWGFAIATGIIFPFGCVFTYIMGLFVWLALFENGRNHAVARMSEIYFTFFDDNGKYTEDWRINLRLDLHIEFLFNFIAYFGPVIFLGYKIAAGARDFMKK